MVGEGRDLGVVVVGYRQPELVCDALRALAHGSRLPDAVVVVDVDPTDPFEPAACAVDLAVRVITVDGNPGYAAACNRGAAALDTRWLLFANADVAVSEPALEAVLAEAEGDPSVGVATCRLVLPDRSMDHACHRGIPSVWDSLAYKLRLDRLLPRSRTVGHYRLSWLDPSTTHDVEACSGAFALVRRVALDEIGGWDEAYRFYAEDLDLCLRMRAAGWRVRYVGEHTALHDKGAARRSAPSSEWVRTAALEAHQRFYHEHLEGSTNRLLRPLVELMFRLQRWRLERGRG
jgi:GT2 family glycosyltransferase